MSLVLMDFLCYTIPLAQSSKDCPPCSLLMQTEACTGEKKKETKVQSYMIDPSPGPESQPRVLALKLAPLGLSRV